MSETATANCNGFLNLSENGRASYTLKKLLRFELFQIIELTKTLSTCHTQISRHCEFNGFIRIQRIILYLSDPIHTIKLVRNDTEMFFFVKRYQVFLRTRTTIVTDETRFYAINLVKESMNLLSLTCFAMFFIVNGIMQISTDYQTQIDREMSNKN